jgi:hypothetical protein
VAPSRRATGARENEARSTRRSKRIITTADRGRRHSPDRNQQQPPVSARSDVRDGMLRLTMSARARNGLQARHRRPLDVWARRLLLMGVRRSRSCARSGAPHRALCSRRRGVRQGAARCPNSKAYGATEVRPRGTRLPRDAATRWESSASPQQRTREALGRGEANDRQDGP